MLCLLSYFYHSLTNMCFVLFIYIYRIFLLLINMQDSVIKRSDDCCLDIYSDSRISSGSWFNEQVRTHVILFTSLV